MTMGQMEYCLGCNVSFRVASKHTGQVLNRLERRMSRGLGWFMSGKEALSGLSAYGSLTICLLDMLQAPYNISGKGQPDQGLPMVSPPQSHYIRWHYSHSRTCQTEMA